MRRLLATSLVFLLAAAAPVPPDIQAALSASDRPAADRARDADRHPGELLALAGVTAGGHVADLMPGGGYYTRLFSHAVGPSGHVYAIIPAELANVAHKSVDAMTALTKGGTTPNVTLLVLPTAKIAAPEPLDLAWTSDNYHDIYAFFGPDQAAAFDRAIFAALKPGGAFMVIDHVAPAGTQQAAMRTLHRIDPEIVRAQVIAAGFRLDEESGVLANPADTHDKPAFDPSVRGHTDQFVMLFRKPAETKGK
jgi:predicted methyltransferase